MTDILAVMVRSVSPPLESQIVRARARTVHLDRRRRVEGLYQSDYGTSSGAHRWNPAKRTLQALRSRSTPSWKR